MNNLTEFILITVQLLYKKPFTVQIGLLKKQNFLNGFLSCSIIFSTQMIW